MGYFQDVFGAFPFPSPIHADPFFCLSPTYLWLLIVDPLASNCFPPRRPVNTMSPRSRVFLSFPSPDHPELPPPLFYDPWAFLSSLTPPPPPRRRYPRLAPGLKTTFIYPWMSPPPPCYFRLQVMSPRLAEERILQRRCRPDG